MIPSTKAQLLVAETWTKLYQNSSNADFQSYDFDTLRRTMIAYLQETYPEEFNDYINSSEYIALVDLIAYVGQNLSFRVDLNARENFLETAQRKDSVLRLAQLISYNPKRNIPASGLLKITSIRTTDNIIDSNGINLANQVVAWNDSSNNNWYQQFINIMNSAMTPGSVFGLPDDTATLNGISAEQYRFNSRTDDLSIYSLSKSINGTQMTFEITGAAFTGKNYIYEQTPRPGAAFSLVYQNDNQGTGSANTGFFVYFRQGSMSSSVFSVPAPVPNEIIGINANGVNNDDVWLWQLGTNGSYDTLWTRVDGLVGNNVVYNNISKNIRTIYSVTSRNNDQIDLNFADGSFGNLPKGDFVVFYRQSNGQNYSITPDQMSGINVNIPYTNKMGATHQLTLTLSLQNTVSNSSNSETIDNIKTNAPQNYYLQNRMITAEDYSIGPLSASNNVLKVTSINRVSSGISKYFELSDISGRYSNTDIFAHDGILYKENKKVSFTFKFTTRNQVFAVIKERIEPIVASGSFRNFYYENYSRPNLESFTYAWEAVTNLPNQTTGYISNTATSIPVPVGYFGSSSAIYITTGALIKFNITPPTVSEPNRTPTYVWSKVIQVIGDGANSGKGKLNDGTGPIILSGKIPTSAKMIEVIPAFVSVFNYAFETQISNLCMVQRNFGLSFDRLSRQWFVILESNLDLVNAFSLIYQKDVTNSQKDSSWMIAFEWNGTGYTVTHRLLEYIFESANQTAFFVDYNNVNYDYVTRTLIKDQIDVLAVNSNVSTSTLGLSMDYRWQIESTIIEPDGYIEPKKVIVSFYDANNDGQIDTPDAFIDIVDPNKTRDKFVYFKILSDGSRYELLSDQSLITSYKNSDEVNSPVVGKLYYFYDIDVIQEYDASGSFILNNTYFARPGRSGIKFHYMHNSGEERRIDPSKSNIIDVYVLTASYDTAFRQYLVNGAMMPPAPTSQSLENDFSTILDPIKSISDTLVYHPANYKILFGSTASPNLQATFKAVRNPERITSDNYLKSRIIYAIDTFFRVENWNFGQTFNFTELSAFVMVYVSPDIINFIITPKNPSLPFGSLFEISCQSNEILISGATINDIDIIDAVTSNQINAISPIINNTNVSN